jgi:hypothetical protein
MPPNDMPAPPSAEQIARHYAAMMDSVNLINALVPTQDDKARDSVARNVLHLEQMLTNNWWSGYDLAPINVAITAGKQ